MLFSFVLITLVYTACKEDAITEHGLDSDQLTAGRIAGVWENPSNIITPDDVPEEVFGEMRLRFTTDDQGYPDQFAATGCPIVFSTGASSWSLNVGNEVTTLMLADVVPVDSFNVVEVTGNALTLSFYMGWENTETGDMGEGTFGVTLTRQ